MDEFISANPCNFDHASLFELVQRLTLDHRLNDSYSCLVSKLYHANCSLVNQEASQVRYTRRPSLSHYRAGLVLARYLSWTNTALATASEAVIATCVTWATYWRGRRTEPWLTPPFCTTALPSVLLTSMEIGRNTIAHHSCHAQHVWPIKNGLWRVRRPCHLGSFCNWFFVFFLFFFPLSFPFFFSNLLNEPCPKINLPCPQNSQIGHKPPLVSACPSC